MPDAPVTPEVVEWAIAESGMTVENIASRIQGIDASDVTAWMKGGKKPSRGQLTQLADTLKRPRVMFFLPEAPTESSLPDGLRKPAGERPKGSTELSFDERLWVRRAYQLQDVLARLSERTPDVPQVSQRDDVESVAATLRNWTGVTRSTQSRWRSAHEGFHGWREAFEENSVAVLAIPMGRESVRGFALNDDQAPVIAVNTADIPEARCFTLCHELAHLALGRDSSCAYTNRGGTERWCDMVASRILIPRALLRDQVNSTDHDDLDDDLALVKHVANHFKVSRLAAAVALEDAGVVEGAYAQVKAAWPQIDREKEDRPVKGRTTPRRRVAEYGGFAVRTILAGLQSERINELEASDFLRLDRTLLAEAGKHAEG